MTNREGNFNRTNAKKLKQIRDKRKANFIGNRRKYGKDEAVKPLTKKQERKQKNFKKVQEQMGIKKDEFLSKATIRRRNKRNRSLKQSTNVMEVDE